MATSWLGTTDTAAISAANSLLLFVTVGGWVTATVFAEQP